MNDSFYELDMMVNGRVQGVGFRYYTEDIAKRLRVFGWVRNTPDGRVEIKGYGRKKNLEQFKELIRKGPALSYVKEIQEEWDEIEHPLPLSDFSIKF